MSKIVFNHCYILRHDDKRSYIIGREDVKMSNRKFDSGIISKIHPIYAMIFSFFSKPIEREEAVKMISDFLDMDETNNMICDLIEKFVNNESAIDLEYEGFVNHIPTNILIDEADSIAECKFYSPIDFVYTDLDFESQRFCRAPLGIVYVVNNRCYTNCIYCYADKRVNSNMLSLDVLENIFRDAKQMGILEIGLSGGELFLYNNWRRLLDLLLKYDYKPSLVSTKIPLDKKTILDFKQYDIPLQISLDSINRDILSKILNVSDSYAELIKSTIRLIDSYGLNYQIATVIVKLNESLQEIMSLYSFISSLDNVSRWEVRTAFKSLYSNCDFVNIRPTNEAINLIDQWLKSIDSKLNILWVPPMKDKYFKSDKGSQYFEGNRCSANYSHMILLPDGKVTICEQLYWNPRFIIGDLTKQSIAEVWNSKKALELANPDKQQFRENSPCKKCNLFEQCISFSNRCIVDILKAYGLQNIDYPDPRCKNAPTFLYEIV